MRHSSDSQVAHVYLDGHATMPLAPEAAAVMVPLWAEEVGNAHSQHGRGQAAAARVETARRQIAQLIGAEPSELIFTSGATEANNLALFGIAEAARRQGLSRRKIVASAVEHKSVLAVLDELAADGFEVALAPVTRDGLVDLAALAALVDDETLLVSVMGANNEVGVMQPLAAVAAIARPRGALVHSDLAQLAGKVRVDVAALDLDYASLSAHKMYGPRAWARSMSRALPKCDRGRGCSGAGRRGACVRALSRHRSSRASEWPRSSPT